MTSTYLLAIKRALTGGADTPLVFVCNFEAEDDWARGHVGLRGLTPARMSPVVRSMMKLKRKSHDIHRCNRRAAHGVDIRERIRRRNPSKVIRVVDQRREEVDGLHQCQFFSKRKHRRIISRRRPHE